MRNAPMDIPDPGQTRVKQAAETQCIDVTHELAHFCTQSVYNLTARTATGMN